MTNRIRADLDGVVIVRDASEQLVTLAAGDDVPDGVTVGAHALEPDVESEGTEEPEDAEAPEEPEDAEAPESSDAESYTKHLKADLLKLIEDRNAVLDEAAQIVPASDKKADLVAALEADDAARAN